MSDKTELELLKERAKKLNISFSPNIGLQALKDKVAAELTTPEPEPKQDTMSEARKARLELAKRRKAAKLEAEKLIRIRVTCMNPAKKEWKGEIITVSNKLVGTQRKMVPFVDHEDGYHVPQFILNVLKNRRFQQFTTKKMPNGQETRIGKLVKEFAIEILPPLTKTELSDLAKAQAAAGGV